MTGTAIRATIETVLRSDHHPTIPQLRQAVAGAHGRAIGDGELNKIARRIYRRMYIDPRAAKAQETLRERPNHQWEYHQARSEADPFNYFNPFGVDSDEIRLRALIWTNQLLDELRSRGKLKPSDHNTAHTGASVAGGTSPRTSTTTNRTAAEASPCHASTRSTTARRAMSDNGCYVKLRPWCFPR